MAVRTNASEEKPYPSVFLYFFLIKNAFLFQILCISVQYVDVFGRNINMIQQVLVHKIMVAVRMIFRKAYVFIHIEGHYISERYLAFLMEFYQFVKSTDGRRSGGKTQNKRSGFYRISPSDLVCYVIGHPFTQFIIILVNYNSHGCFPFLSLRYSRTAQ